MYATADLIDEFESELRSCPIQFRNYGGHASFYGAVRTLVCCEDNALLKSTLETPGQGSVLVIDGGGSLRTALVGDVIAAIAAGNGWAGLVIYGAVRDSAKLAHVGLGIKALGTNPSRSSKTAEGFRDVPISIGGALFEPGDWIYCDEDGVVIAKRPIHEELARR